MYKYRDKNETYKYRDKNEMYKYRDKNEMWKVDCWRGSYSINDLQMTCCHYTDKCMYIPFIPVTAQK
jgi:hypothetical protein